MNYESFVILDTTLLIHHCSQLSETDAFFFFANSGIVGLGFVIGDEDNNINPSGGIPSKASNPIQAECMDIFGGRFGVQKEYLIDMEVKFSLQAISYLSKIILSYTGIPTQMLSIGLLSKERITLMLMIQLTKLETVMQPLIMKWTIDLISCMHTTL